MKPGISPGWQALDPGSSCHLQDLPGHNSSWAHSGHPLKVITKVKGHVIQCKK